jgi:hypothetical protein
MEIQARIPAALCALHNFIRRNDPSDIEDFTSVTDNSHIRVDNPGIGNLAISTITPARRQMADDRREQIAQEMWDSYQAIVHERGVHMFEELSDT